MRYELTLRFDGVESDTYNRLAASLCADGLRQAVGTVEAELIDHAEITEVTSDDAMTISFEEYIRDFINEREESSP